MQVHQKSFVPSLMSNFMVLDLEAGGGGWDSSRSHVLYKDLCWCQIAAWRLLFYCSPPGFPLKSAARVAGDQCRNSSYTGCCVPGASSLLSTTSNTESNDISGEEVGELSWASAPLCLERAHVNAESTLPVLLLASVQCAHRRRDEGTNNPGQMCNHTAWVSSGWCWDVVMHAVWEQI